MFEMFTVASATNSFNVSEFYAKRDAIGSAFHGPSPFDFGPMVILIVLGLVAIHIYRANRSQGQAEHRLYDDKRRFDAEKERGREELERLRAELHQAKHLLALYRADAYVPEGEVQQDVPKPDEVFGAKRAAAHTAEPVEAGPRASVDEEAPRGAPCIDASDASVLEAIQQEERARGKEQQ